MAVYAIILVRRGFLIIGCENKYGVATKKNGNLLITHEVKVIL